MIRTTCLRRTSRDGALVWSVLDHVEQRLVGAGSRPQWPHASISYLDPVRVRTAATCSSSPTPRGKLLDERFESLDDVRTRG